MHEDREFIKARDYAYRLLSYRSRSVRELEGRLKKKGFAQVVIQKTITYLSEINYLDDEEFARFWIHAKMQANPVGVFLLRRQLKQKGVPEEILQQALSDAAGQYDELEVAKKLAVSRRSRYKDLKDQRKLKKRLYGYLYRRGFSPEVILQAINYKL